MRVFTIIAALFILLFPMIPMAKEKHDGACYSCHSLNLNEAGELTNPLNVKVKSVEPSPMKGFFEVRAERDGKEGLIFIDFAKKHLMQGVMVSVEDLKSSRVPAPIQKDASKLLIMNSVCMGNPNASKKLFVFSDPDCPFCRQVHNELRQLVGDEDIAVYVKPYPLDSHPGAYEKARAILEANSLELLHKVFAGEKAPLPTNPNSKIAVDDIIGLVKSLGITGTPAFLLPNGKIEVGFRNAAALKKVINMK